MDTNAHSELDQDDLDSKEMKNEEESERGTMEMFVNSENDNTEAMRDILLNRIKMEPNEYDWAECSGNYQGEFKADSCAVKEEVSIKKEDIEESIDPFDPDSHGINTGHSEGDNLNEYAASKEEIKIEPVAVKLEMDIDSEDFKISEITEEFIIKSDGETSMDASSDAAPNSSPKSKILGKPQKCSHCDAEFNAKALLDEHIVRVHPEFIATITNKLYECPKCPYKTVFKRFCFNDHLRTHREIAKKLLSKCIYCDQLFKRRVSLDEHIIKKHPNFIKSVTRKIYECSKCSLKTRYRYLFYRHMEKHWADSRKLNTCIHCNKTFKWKRILHEHIIRKHPDCITSVDSKIYECSKCSFKTVQKRCFERHILTHPKTCSTNMLEKCSHCHGTFETKLELDNHVLKEHPVKCIHCDGIYKKGILLDEHVIKKHPIFTKSITREDYECSKCNSSTHSTCIHCDKTFKQKSTLFDHIMREHPDFTASVDRKIHECLKCGFKSVRKSHIERHMLTRYGTCSQSMLKECIWCNKTFESKQNLDVHVLKVHPKFITSITNEIHKHPEIYSSYKVNKCIHCDQSFKNRTYLDNHVIKNHPNVISSVTRKIYACSECNFKTIFEHVLYRHIVSHSVADSAKISTCIHCNKTFKRKFILHDHIIRNHPDFITSVDSKIYKCSKCAYKTVQKSGFDRHMLKHPGTYSANKLKKCIHCDATFKTKQALDDHTVKFHPHVISTLTNKVHTCTKCSYRTVKKRDFDKHTSTHHVS